MSDIRIKYKNSTNKKCLNDITLSADDILRAYDNRSKNASNDAPKTLSKTRVTMLQSAGKVAGIAAATVLILGLAGVTAGAMGYGPLANLFKEKVDDPTSAELVEQGYILEVGTTQSSNGFDVTLEGITGTTYSPVMLFSIRTDDEDFVANHETFNLTVYSGLGLDEYEHNRIDLGFENIVGDAYGFDTVEAVQDSVDPHLYYAKCPGASRWMNDGEDFIVALRSIQLGIPDSVGFEEIMLDGKWILNCPTASTVFQESETLFYNQAPMDSKTFVSDNGLEYHLRFVDIDVFRTEVNFGYRYLGTDFAGGEEDFSAISDELHAEWLSVIENTVIKIDGEEFSMTESFVTWCDEDGMIGPAKDCCVSAYFPSAAGAESVSLVYDGTEIVIK